MNILLTVLKGRKSMMKAPPELVSDEGFLSASNMAASVWILTNLKRRTKNLYCVCVQLCNTHMQRPE